MIGGVHDLFVTAWQSLEEDTLPLIAPADRHMIPNFGRFWSALPEIEQPSFGWRKTRLGKHTSNDNSLAVVRYQRASEMSWGDSLWDKSRLVEWKSPILQHVPREGHNRIIGGAHSAQDYVPILREQGYQVPFILTRLEGSAMRLPGGLLAYKELIWVAVSDSDDDLNSDSDSDDDSVDSRATSGDASGANQVHMILQRML